MDQKQKKKKKNADHRACKQDSAELWTDSLHVCLQTELSVIRVISSCLKAYIGACYFLVMVLLNTKYNVVL